MTRAQRLAQDGFLTIKEAQRFLSISKSAMYRLVESQTISHAKFRGRIAIPKRALEEYAAARMTIGKVA